MSTIDFGRGRSPADQAAGSSTYAALCLGERFHLGDPAALAKVLRDLCPLLCRRLSRRYKDLLSFDRAEHLALEAIAQGWRRHRDYDPTKGPLIAWLSTVADHAAADFLDSPQGQSLLLEIALDPNALAELRDARAPDSNAPTNCTRAEELLGLVNKALEEIGPKYRDVLLAFACAPDGELSSAQLAAELGVSASTIRMRHKRGLASLEGALRRLGVEEILFCDTQTVFTSEGQNKNGERRTENGERRTENGERRTENNYRILISVCVPVAHARLACWLRWAGWSHAA